MGMLVADWISIGNLAIGMAVLLATRLGSTNSSSILTPRTRRKVDLKNRVTHERFLLLLDLNQRCYFVL